MSQKAYPALDALRGVAALSVLLFHAAGIVRFAHDPSFGIEPPTHGYLAVDFFYILSGFVVAHAYQRRLDTGWPPSAFFAARVRRLYPTVLLGLGLGLAVHLLVSAVRGRLNPAVVVLDLMSAALGLLLVPLLGPQGGDAFPLDGPLWSISQEFAANLVYGYLGRRASALGVAAVCGLGALACAAEIVVFGRLETGARPCDFVLGAARIAYGFPLGLLLQRAHASGLTRRCRGPGPLALAAVLTLALGLPAVGAGASPLVDAACVFVLFPWLILAGCEARTAPGFGQGIAALSFPLYATHLALRPAWVEVLPTLPPLVGLAAMLAVSLGVARLAQALLQRAAPGRTPQGAPGEVTARLRTARLRTE